MPYFDLRTDFTTMLARATSHSTILRVPLSAGYEDEMMPAEKHAIKNFDLYALDAPESQKSLSEK